MARTFRLPATTTKAKTTSVQPRFQRDVDRAYGFIMGFAREGAEIPPYGDPQRDEKLAEVWRREPILAGAMGSMAQKVAGLSWSITGGRNRVGRASRMLAGVQDGFGWQAWLQQGGLDFWARDNGWFIELGRETQDGAVVDLFNMDSTRVRATGRRDWPYQYQPAVGGGPATLIPQGGVVRLVSLPSPEERHFGLGFSAVSRAVRAARLLMAVHDYDWEKLSTMPPQGVASVTGMTSGQVLEAMSLYEADREAKGRHTFPGILWLASALPGAANVAVNMTPFSSLPESFDRETVVNLYVYTLALAFGVDAREFWPATVTGATKGDALVQAQKAKGKGPAEFMSAVERMINFHVLPEGVDFAFDFQDDEEDLRRAQINQLHTQNASLLVTPPAGALEGIITTEEARRLLVEWGVLPEDMALSPETTADDADVHKALSEPMVKARWRSGVITELLLNGRVSYPSPQWGETLLREVHRAG